MGDLQNFILQYSWIGSSGINDIHVLYYFIHPRTLYLDASTQVPLLGYLYLGTSVIEVLLVLPPPYYQCWFAVGSLQVKNLRLLTGVSQVTHKHFVNPQFLNYFYLEGESVCPLCPFCGGEQYLPGVTFSCVFSWFQTRAPKFDLGN